MRLKHSRVILVILVLMVSSSSMFNLIPITVEAQELGAWNIEGERIFIDDENVHISISPHTIGSSGWIEFTITSKKFTGLVDAVFGFNTTSVKPVRAEIWRNYSHTIDNRIPQNVSKTITLYDITDQKMINLEEFNTGLNKIGNEYNEHFYRVNCTLNEGTPFNETGTYYIGYNDYSGTLQELEVNYTDTEIRNIPYQTTFYDWKAWDPDVTVINFDYDGMNRWYAFRQMAVEAGKNYTMRFWVDVQFRGLDNVSGKYSFGIKRSSDTIHEAVANERFYYMDPWYNTNWQYSMKITIDNTDSSENLMNFPEYMNLTRAHEEDTFNFSQTRNDGLDVVFTDSDNVTLLNWEVEYYNQTENAGHIWVQIPQEDAGSSTDYFTMWWGNPSATDQSNPTGTWDQNYTLVHHLNEGNALENATHYDSTINNNDGFPTGFTGASDSTQNAEGLIAGSVVSSGTAEYIEVPKSVSLNISTEITMTALINSPIAQPSATVVMVDNHNYGLLFGHSGADYRGSLAIKQGNTFYNSDGPVEIPQNQWNLVVGVFNGTRLTFYVNGDEKSFRDVGSKVMSLNDDPVTFFSGQTTIGGFLDANMDEIRISDKGRSPSYVKATYQSLFDLRLTFSGPQEIPNVAPVNIQITITNMDDTNFIYPAKRNYTVEALANDTDASGGDLLTEIDFVMIAFYDGSTWVNASHDVGGNTWSLVSGDSVAVIFPGSRSTNGNQLTVTFSIYLLYDIDDELDMELYQYVNDTSGLEDPWEEKQTDYVNIESDLEVNTASMSDTRANIGSAQTVTGRIYYQGTSTIPPAGTSVYEDIGSQTDTTDGSGDYSISITLSGSVQNTSYVIYAENNTISAVNKTVWTISDRIIVYWEQVNDSRASVNAYVSFDVKAVLDYDDHVVGSGDTLSCAFGGLTWDAGNSWWAINNTEASVGAYSIGTWSASEATYGISTIAENITETVVVYDQIQLQSLSVNDSSPSVGEVVLILAKAQSAYDGHVLNETGDGLTLKDSAGGLYVLSFNGTHWTGTATEASNVTRTINTYHNVTETNYTITSLDMNNLTLEITWGIDIDYTGWSSYPITPLNVAFKVSKKYPSLPQFIFNAYKPKLTLSFDNQNEGTEMIHVSIRVFRNNKIFVASDESFIINGTGQGEKTYDLKLRLSRPALYLTFNPMKYRVTTTIIRVKDPTTPITDEFTVGPPNGIPQFRTVAILLSLYMLITFGYWLIIGLGDEYF